MTQSSEPATASTSPADEPAPSTTVTPEAATTTDTTQQADLAGEREAAERFVLCFEYKSILLDRMMHYGLGKYGWGDDLADVFLQMDPEMAELWEFISTEDEMETPEGVSIYNELERQTLEECGAPLNSTLLQMDGNCVIRNAGLTSLISPDDTMTNEDCLRLDELKWPCFAEFVEDEDGVHLYRTIDCATATPIRVVGGPKWEEFDPLAE